MQESLERLSAGQPAERLLDFAELRELLGFAAYDQALTRYTGEGR